MEVAPTEDQAAAQTGAADKWRKLLATADASLVSAVPGEESDHDSSGSGESLSEIATLYKSDLYFSSKMRVKVTVKTNISRKQVPVRVPVHLLHICLLQFRSHPSRRTL